MPEKATLERARKAKRNGRAPSTQAGAFVREEIHHVREGKHGARSAKQVIAIGLAKARRAGVALPPRPGTSDKALKPRAGKRPSPARARAALSKLKHEGRASASHLALSRQARSARKRSSRRSRAE